jgi:hypothetical protein
MKRLAIAAVGVAVAAEMAAGPGPTTAMAYGPLGSGIKARHGLSVACSEPKTPLGKWTRGHENES